MQVVQLAPVLQAVQGQDRSQVDLGPISQAEQDLRGIAALAALMLHMHSDIIPERLGSLAVKLHNECLIEVQDSPDVVEAVVKLCLDYWALDGPDAGALSIQLVRLSRLSHITFLSLASQLRLYALPWC